MTFWQNLADWSLGGIDFDLAGNGGLECRDHVTVSRRLMETCLGMGVPLFGYFGHKLISKETSKEEATTQLNAQYSPVRLALLVSLSFVFGIEVGYKFATKSLIWLMNPCHVTSVLQIYFLATPSSYTNTVGFLSFCKIPEKFLLVMH